MEEPITDFVATGPWPAQTSVSDTGIEPVTSSVSTRSGPVCDLHRSLYRLLTVLVLVGVWGCWRRLVARSSPRILPKLGSLPAVPASRRASFARPGRVRLVQVERPTGRTTWTRRTRSGCLRVCDGSRCSAGHPGVARVQGRSPGRRRPCPGCRARRPCPSEAWSCQDFPLYRLAPRQIPPCDGEEFHTAEAETVRCLDLQAQRRIGVQPFGEPPAQLRAVLDAGVTQPAGRSRRGSWCSVHRWVDRASRAFRARPKLRSPAPTIGATDRLMFRVPAQPSVASSGPRFPSTRQRGRRRPYRRLLVRCRSGACGVKWSPQRCPRRRLPAQRPGCGSGRFFPRDC
jgi:hypothetical protein